jgi:CDP-diacylglycerol--serine O-phosphatidyltransferase
MLKQNLPNALTLGNLLCGCLGIQQVLAGNPELAPWLIIIAGVLDFFDGMLARALGVFSNIGKDLDSLADVVSFGVLPGFMVFYLINHATEISETENLYAYLAFLIPIFSAYRLAKFNNDERQSSSFIGLPTPANAFFWIGIFYASVSEKVEFNVSLLIILATISSLLLISPIPMFSFKLKKGISFQKMWPQIVLLIISIPSLLIFKATGFAIIVSSYLTLSILDLVISKSNIKLQKD